MDKKKEKSGSCDGLERENRDTECAQLYTANDVKKLYKEMMDEHYSTTLIWLKRIYPGIVAGQCVLFVFLVSLAGMELSFDTLSPLSPVGVCVLLSVTWPMLLAPRNRSKIPTMVESEFLLAARYIQANNHMPHDELAKRIVAHRRVIQHELLNDQMLRNQHPLAWLYYRLR